jgi:NAD-dependent deacetylase
VQEYDEAALEQAAATLTSASYVIALVGAGISVESGIPPFRGKGGLWTKRGEPRMDGYRRFMEDPAAGWRDMLARRRSDDEFALALAAAAPNPAHFALARLEEIGVLRHTISQNIDDLHFRAGSVAVTEIHGNRTKVRCIDCGARWTWDEFLARALAQQASQPAGTRQPAAPSDPWDAMARMELPPYCPQCRGMVKSDTVMFGEPIPRPFLEECQRQAERADCVLIAGTSATVYPAAAFPEIVLQRGGAVVEVNTDETPFTPHAAAVLRGPAGELLPLLVERIAATT